MKLNNCQNRDRSNHPTSLEMQESLGGPENEEAGLPLGGRCGREVEPNERLDCLERLPEPEEPNFVWGNDLPGDIFCDRVNKAYEEVVHWRRNVFLLPFGKVSKAFVQEVADLMQAFAQKTSLECIALKACFLMQTLLLQKPGAKSKAKDHVNHLKRRFESWKEGDIEALLAEGRCIQAHLPRRTPSPEDESVSRTFSKMMFAGNVHGALNYLSRKSTGSPLKIDDVITISNGSSVTVEEALLSLHPEAKSVDSAALLENTLENALPVDPVMFTSINGLMIKDIALHSTGTAGPSGIDAAAWRKMCSSFKEASSNLCDAIAGVARRMCTARVAPEALSALLACRLVPLNKNPGVRPIGVGEVVRRIIGKAVMKVLKKDVMLAAGPLQTCSGIPSGGEAAVHAVRETWERPDMEGVLLVDASNAFNSLNRKVALLNMKHVCPALEVALTNCYQNPSRLFVSGGGEILSREGTTQGDPLGMAMFSLAMVPLIIKLMEQSESTVQAWFADDATGVGSLQNLKQWWDGLSTIGPLFGYYPNAAKTCLVVRDEQEEVARQIFDNTDVVITTEGKKHLGAAIGSPTFVEDFFSLKVKEWTDEVEKLAAVAGSQPQAAYAAFVHGTKHKWNYLCRTTPNCSHLLQPLEDAIHRKLIPAISGRPSCSQVERGLLALPAKLGGLSLSNPTTAAQSEFEASKKITASLVQSIIQQRTSFENDPTQANPSVNVVKKRKVEEQKRNHEEIRNELEPSSQRLIDCASEPGASAWLTALPLEEHGFCLSKGSFRDSLCLRYGWPIVDVSSRCACGTAFSVEHAMTCHKGGIPTLRHNEIRDLTAELLKEQASNVSTEPRLQPLHDERFQFRSANREDEARLDVRASDFWCKGQEAFFDIRVFYPIAPSYRQKDLTALYRMHEQEKKRQYAERVREVEHGVFTPLVFASTGGMARECTIFFKRIADTLSDKKQIPFSQIMYLIRCRISFALLRSAVRAIRGSRSSRRPDDCGIDFDRAITEGQL